MQQEIERLHRRLAHSKFSIYLIVGFLALLTYLLVIISNQVTQQASLDLRSRASESYLNMMRGSEVNDATLETNNPDIGGPTNPRIGGNDGIEIRDAGTARMGALPIVQCEGVCKRKLYSTSPEEPIGQCAPGLTCQDVPTAPGFGLCYPPDSYGSCKNVKCGETCQTDSQCMGAMRCMDVTVNGVTSKACVESLNCKANGSRPFLQGNGQPLCNGEVLKNQIARGNYKGCCLELESGHACSPGTTP